VAPGRQITRAWSNAETPAVVEAVSDGNLNIPERKVWPVTNTSKLLQLVTVGEKVAFISKPSVSRKIKKKALKMRLNTEKFFHQIESNR